MPQQPGSLATVKIDREATYGTARSGSSVRAFNLGYTACNLGGQQSISPSAALNGDRNESEPFTGSIDDSGDLTCVVDFEMIGLLLQWALDGSPTRNEIDVTTDVMSGTPTIAIASGTGAYTFSEAQASSAVGDRVLYPDANGDTIYGYITTRTNDTTGTISLERDAGTAAPDTSAVNVVAIATNLAETSPGDASLTSGTLTFDTAQTNLAVNQVVIMDVGGTVKRHTVTAVTSTTVCTVVDEAGFEPADHGSLDVESIEDAIYYDQTFVPHATNPLPSYTVERGFPSITTPAHERNVGVKVNSFALNMPGRGEEEFLVTLGLIGANETDETTAQDATISAVNILGKKVLLTMGTSTKEGSPLVTTTAIKNFSYTVENDLDEDSFHLGGGGIRNAIPEGRASASGTVEAIFSNSSLITKSIAFTTTGFEVIFTTGKYSLTFRVREAKMARNSPNVDGPRGVLQNLDWRAFYSNSIDNTDLGVTSVILRTIRHSFV